MSRPGSLDPRDRPSAIDTGGGITIATIIESDSSFDCPNAAVGADQPTSYAGPDVAQSRRGRREVMAKGQQRSNKEVRKPKKAKVKTIAANPSQKGGARGLEHLKND